MCCSPDCPACFEAPKERQRIKLLLASQEHVHPNLYPNMLQSEARSTRRACNELMVRLQLAHRRVAVCVRVVRRVASLSLRAMRPLLGLENNRLATAAGVSGDAADEDGLVTLTTSTPANAALVRALQGSSTRGEEDEEDAVLDALCKAPGGACAIPPKTNKGTRPPAAASANHRQ